MSAVELVVEAPDGPGPFPALLLAPGRGYHMDLPLVRDLTRALPSVGWVGVRFDWVYQRLGTAPSDDLLEERAQLRSALNQVRAMPSIDPARVVLGGKSMGSTLAWQGADEHVPASVLLTPVLRSFPDCAEYYPGLETSRRPTLLLAGKEDPLGAAVAQVGARTHPRVTTIVVGGDHGLCDQGHDSAHVPTAIALVVAWLQAVLC